MAGWYHVTSCGNERRPVFRDERDRQHLGMAIRRYEQKLKNDPVETRCLKNNPAETRRLKTALQMLYVKM